MYEPLIKDGNNKFGNNRWLTYSLKIRRDIYLFSDLEYENWLLIESNPRILEFCEQPKLMQVSKNGKLMSSIVDMWIKYDDGSEEFQEIKYTSDLDKEKVVRQIEIQKLWCEEHGYKHCIRTENQIRDNRLLLSNLKLIVSGIKNQSELVEFDKFRITKMMNMSKEKIQISELCQQTQIPLNKLLIALGQMILNGDIFSDISRTYYGVKTEVWIDETKDF